jgi:hypothetical protein
LTVYISLCINVNQSKFDGGTRNIKNWTCKHINMGRWQVFTLSRVCWWIQQRRQSGDQPNSMKAIRHSELEVIFPWSSAKEYRIQKSRTHAGSSNFCPCNTLSELINRLTSVVGERNDERTWWSIHRRNRHTILSGPVQQLQQLDRWTPPRNSYKNKRRKYTWCIISTLRRVCTRWM